jgi:hypothetical protein
VLLHVKNSFTWTKQNNSKNKLKPSKHKHKLNTIIRKIISSKISINKQNYKNNYLYLTLGWKGLGIKTQYHAVVHQCVLYHSNRNINMHNYTKTQITHSIVNNPAFNSLMVKVIILNSYLMIILNSYLIVLNIISFNLLHFNSN